MAKIDEYIGLMRKHADADVDFLAVYLREAHPTDGWAMDDVAKHPSRQPVALGERLANARILREYVGAWCPVVADNMRDEALRAYGAFPERLCVLLNGRVACEGRMGPFGYDLAEIDRCLDGVLHKSQ